MKPSKQADKIVTITIEDDGNLTFLATESSDVFLELGTVITRRASHVEPANFWQRIAFRILRTLASDDSRAAAWTRTWNTLWHVDTRPVGGPVLTYGHLWEADGTADVLPVVRTLHMYNRVKYFSDRQTAIDAEVKFLNKFFAERGTK